MMKKRFFSPIFLMLFGLTMIGLAACGGGGSGGNSTSNDNNSSAATEVRPTIIPTYNFVLPTASPAKTTEATSEATADSGSEATAEATASTASTSLDPEKVALGQGRYTALECNTCHGETGEGVADKGPALNTFAMTEDDFISFMRSGGKLGAAHQFATNRLSITGGANLYQYLLSLVQS